MPTSKVHPTRSVVPAATASKSTKVSAKKPAAAKAKTSNSPSAGKGLPRKARKPASLPKSDGDAGVQAYIASMEPWQAAIAKRVDALVVKHVPGVRKAVRWHCPFYGVEGQGWFLAFSGFQHHVKFSFFKGTSLKPVPPIGQFKDVRSLDVRESDKIDEKQLATWIKQFKLTESGLVVEMPQIDVSFSAGVEKLRRLNESFEGILEESGSFRRRT
jgi:hypothetical protein